MCSPPHITYTSTNRQPTHYHIFDRQLTAATPLALATLFTSLSILPLISEYDATVIVAICPSLSLNVTIPPLAFASGDSTHIFPHSTARSPKISGSPSPPPPRIESDNVDAHRPELQRDDVVPPGRPHAQPVARQRRGRKISEVLVRRLSGPRL